jgi:F-type H+-transporting ATPase subunit gamma
MPSTKDIQRRIKSVNSTKKITRAMEMVSAAKMRKAVEAVLKTRTYANLSWETVLNLSKAVNGNEELHPLLRKREKIKKIGIVLITSNRGLCGGFNSAIINKIHQSIKKYHYKGEKVIIEAEFVLVGKKGAAIYHRHGHNIVAEFTKLDLASEVKEIVPVAKIIISDYLSGKYDKIMVAYTDFVNPAKQIPRIKQILPIDINSEEEYLGIVGEDTRLKTTKEFIKDKKEEHLKVNEGFQEYIFEPSPREVLDDMIPRLIEIQLYQALLESNASEHSARMAAMRQATEAANDMVNELTLFYNKARQASITAEIAEISAGANALAE